MGAVPRSYQVTPVGPSHPVSTQRTNATQAVFARVRHQVRKPNHRNSGTPDNDTECLHATRRDKSALGARSHLGERARTQVRVRGVGRRHARSRKRKSESCATGIQSLSHEWPPMQDRSIAKHFEGFDGVNNGVDLRRRRSAFSASYRRASSQTGGARCRASDLTPTPCWGCHRWRRQTRSRVRTARKFEPYTRTP